MNKYPLWKNLVVLAAVLLGIIYSLPNFYGEDPAIQVSATRTTKVDTSTVARVEQVLKQANIPYVDVRLEDTGIKVRFTDTDTQFRARGIVQNELGNGYTVALNLLPATPHWLQLLGAKPMYLGLDLRGGVHFLMQVDMRAVLKKSLDSMSDDLRRV